MTRVMVAVFVSLILLATAGPSLASAQETDERVERARALFEQAEAHFAGGQYLPAAAAYQNAYDLMREAGRSTAPLILYNVGRAYDRAGRADQARAAYQRFIADAPADDSETQARVGTARERLEALQAPAPTPARATPTAVRAVPGENAGGGAETSPAADSDDGTGPTPWIVLGVSAAVLITGSTLLALTAADIETVEGVADGGSWADIRDAHDRAQIIGPVGWALAGLGLAGVVVGLGWGIATGSDSEEVQARIGPSGVQVRGRF